MKKVYIHSLLALTLSLPGLALAQDAPPQQPKSCDNIQVRGQGVRQTVERVKGRAKTLCGEDGNSGQIGQASERVGQLLDKCTIPSDPEYSSSLRSVFAANQQQRAKEICANLKKDLDTIDAFCKKQGEVRANAKNTILSTTLSDSGSRSSDSTKSGQYALHSRMVSAYELARDSAKQFHSLSEQLKQQLETRRRQGAQSKENAAHSEDALMRKQEQFFLKAPASRAELFTRNAQTERDQTKRQQMLNAAQACKAAAQSTSPAVQFREAMENHLLPNHENLYKMASALEEQSKADVVKAESDLAAATAARDKFTADAEVAGRPIVKAREDYDNDGGTALKSFKAPPPSGLSTEQRALEQTGKVLGHQNTNADTAQFNLDNKIWEDGGRVLGENGKLYHQYSQRSGFGKVTTFIIPEPK